MSGPEAACKLGRLMLKRPLRRFLAVLAILALTFAQFAAIAHACGDRGAGSRVDAAIAAVAPAAGSAGHHCHGHESAPVQEPELPAANLCEVHCSDGAVPPAAFDLPVVVPTILPAPPPAPAFVLVGTNSERALARSGAPPLLLQFGRLLI